LVAETNRTEIIPPAAVLTMFAAWVDLNPRPDFNRLSIIVPIRAAIKTQITIPDRRRPKTSESHSWIIDPSLG
jgi:hypothetical protein